MDFLKKLWARHGAEIIGSKKFKAFVIGLTIAAAAKLGLSEDVGTTIGNWAIGLAGTYIVAQGAADIGKSSAQIKAANEGGITNVVNISKPD